MMLAQVNWAVEARRIASMYSFDTPVRSAAFEVCVAGCFAANPPLRRTGPEWIKWAAIGLGAYFLLKGKRE